jgi:hypothetical protein
MNALFEQGWRLQAPSGLGLGAAACWGLAFGASWVISLAQGQSPWMGLSQAGREYPQYVAYKAMALVALILTFLLDLTSLTQLQAPRKLLSRGLAMLVWLAGVLQVSMLTDGTDMNWRAYNIATLLYLLLIAVWNLYLAGIRKGAWAYAGVCLGCLLLGAWSGGHTREQHLDGLELAWLAATMAYDVWLGLQLLRHKFDYQ